MRLLSYNIHGCIGRSGVADPESILAVIRDADADVVALQEVHNNDGVDRSFLRALERELDYPVILHGPTMRKVDADYGNLLMCRSSIQAEERIDLSYQDREPRGAIRIRLKQPKGIVEITATHLGLKPAERRTQLDRLMKASEEGTENVVRILIGDLNEWFPWSRAERMLRCQFGRVKTVATFPARFPIFALDRIYVHPNHRVQVTRKTLDSEAARTSSDHLPLVADVEFD